jgi:hypothetical protein
MPSDFVVEYGPTQRKPPVERSTLETSTSTRGRSASRSKAGRLRRRDVSDSVPPERSSHGPCARRRPPGSFLPWWSTRHAHGVSCMWTGMPTRCRPAGRVPRAPRRTRLSDPSTPVTGAPVTRRLPQRPGWHSGRKSPPPGPPGAHWPPARRSHASPPARPRRARARVWGCYCR